MAAIYFAIFYILLSLLYFSEVLFSGNLIPSLRAVDFVQHFFAID